VTATLLAIGCRQLDWQASYLSAVAEFRNGNSDAVLDLIAHLPENPGKNDPIWYWRVRILRAQVFMRRSQPAQALTFVSSFPAKLPNEILIRKNLIAGLALCQTGRAQEALERFADAERIIYSTIPSMRADLLYARGDCISDDHSEEAIRLFIQAAELAHGNDSYLEARALAYQGYLLMQANHCDQAIDVFNQALPITDSPQTRQTLLGDKGWCSQQLGEWIASGQYLRQAVTMSAQIQDAKADHALWLIDLGRQQRSQGEFEDAEKSYEEGLVAAREASRPDLMGLALLDSAEAAIERGNLALAKKKLLAAEQLHVTRENQVYIVANKARIASLEGDQSTAERLYLEILSSDAPAYLKWFAQTSLAQIYLTKNRPKDAEQLFRSGIESAEQDFFRISSDRFRISYFDQNPYYDAYVSFLFSQGRTLDALSVAERGRSRTLAGARMLHPIGRPLSLHLIQRNLALQKHEVVLAYWISPKQSYLWLISATQFKTFTLAPEMDIVREIEAYDRTTADQSEDQTPQGQNLFKMLVAPAEKFIPKGARVIIVPHRRLYKLNFETLITDGEKPHFWIEDVCIQNASFLAGLEKPSKGGGGAYKKQLLLMGNPIQATSDFPGLGHAAQEMEAVAGRFNQSSESIYSKADAKPEAYDSSNPGQYRFLHFVTHGTASDLTPLDSAIILSPGKDGFKLYARDIIKTQIHPELVTISSCYGAGTRQYSGEGLVGLSWAFLRAGAHRVIGALWETDDEANVKLMQTFYGEMKKKDDPAAALRTAKLALLHSDSFWKRPFYWGALQLYSSN
jgi:CHAT domain-containing protein/tetratricopeptide (TPR) repeat protein